MSIPVVSPPRPPRSTNRDLRELVYQLGREIRELWIINRRNYEYRITGKPSNYGAGVIKKWDGGTDDYGKMHVAVWDELAELCICQKLKPKLWVKLLFDHWKGGRRHPPTPPDLKSGEHIARYHAQATQQLERFKIAYDLEKETARRNIFLLERSVKEYSYEQIIRVLIEDQNVVLSPFFKYWLAVSIKAPDLILRVYPDALIQYFFDRQNYDAVWGTEVPKIIKTHADRLEAAFTGGKIGPASRRLNWEAQTLNE